MTFDLKKEYKGNLPWLCDRTIFLTIHGSNAFGTNIPDSDLDVKGICIPPKEIILGFNNKFEQAEQNDPDLVIYSLQKFMYMAANCNPSLIEFLYPEPRFHIIKTGLGQKLINNRHLFLSKKAKHTFNGYAISQLKRMRTHRAWLLNPPKKQPQRADYGLEEGKKVSSSVQGAFDNLLKRGATFDGAVMVLLDKEKKYATAVNHWKQYENWKKTRNPARAKLEAKFGYDVKHAMHLVRLMRMCREILTTGKVIVFRPDAEELLAIRNGAWKYEELISWAEKQDEELNELYEDCNILPHQPDREKLNDLCIELVEELL